MTSNITVRKAEEIFDKISELESKYRKDMEEASYGDPHRHEEEWITCDFKRKLIEICKEHGIRYYPCEPAIDICESIQYKMARIIKYGC